MKSRKLEHCLNCNRYETEIPLISLKYNGNEEWICSQCLPTLIHQPQQLADKLFGSEKLRGADHHHD